MTDRKPSHGAMEPFALPGELPLLTTREVVIYPLMAVPLLIEEKGAVQAIDAAMDAGHKTVALFGVKVGVKEGSDPEALRDEDLYPVGAAVEVGRMVRLPDGRLQILVQGLTRLKLQEILQKTPYPLVQVRKLESRVENSTEMEALARNVLGLFKKAISLAPGVPKEVAAVTDTFPQLDQKADFVISQLNLDFEQQQALLGEGDLQKRFEAINEVLNREIEILKIRDKISSEAAESMDEAQREYILRQQLQAIQEELGEGADEAAELDEFRDKIAQAGMPEDVRKEAEHELKRMENMPQAAAEYTVSRTYLDWLVKLPWEKRTEDRLEVKKADRILEADHYGLEKPKERILEYLSVRHLKNDMKGPILCLVGPPGTGKTSLGRSVARAMGREFVRISLGGVRDESEIRGHRRTYVGALPGRIIQGLRRAKTKNPVFMLDEIDKLGADFRGDPSAALLEVLDPEQNNSFVDHYLDVPFDLSEVLFIATANTLHTVPSALMDRMEILEVSGYTEAEKVEIARRYLMKRQLSEHGLSKEKVSTDKAVILSIVQYYTREAGLRNLEREIGTVLRKVARKFAEGRRRKIRIREKDLANYLGPKRFSHEVAEAKQEVGVAAGLAWTPVGGDVLFVEGSLMPGKGGLKLTGQAGDVMKESLEAAMTYVRSRWAELGLGDDFNQKRDVHIHLPAGAVPKDGPSAGITMATVLASIFTHRPIRNEVAMTGEITLRGKVLPIGGVRDKVLAAHRAGMKMVILPEDNRKDVQEIPEAVRKALRLVFVKHMDEVLDMALIKRPRRQTIAPKMKRSNAQRRQVSVAVTAN